MSYAELHCLSNFSFQRGASSARELFERAKLLGYAALAITDECTLAGIVRALEAARETGVKLIVGAEFCLVDDTRFVLLAARQAGYSALCELITSARRSAEKGEYRLDRAQLQQVLSNRPQLELHTDLLCLWLPARPLRSSPLDWLTSVFPSVWIALELHHQVDDALHLAELQALSQRTGVALVACGDVHMHARGRRALLDVLSAIRHHGTIASTGLRLPANGEHHLRRIEQVQALYPPTAIAETLKVAGRIEFDLGQLHYEYPQELVPAGHSAGSWLSELTWAGARRHWPEGISDKVRKLLEHELALIGELRYEYFFLTVWDVVNYARSVGILCQGRGSAANSAVCFCLGITAVDPARMSMLFERFLSRERNEPPDIDVDFEHQRREEVIQYIYRKYGRERAALAATVICYRSKSALRDVGRALGLNEDELNEITRALAWWDGIETIDERLAERGFDPASPVLRKLVTLVRELVGFPRHLSQHVGGFVISHQPLSELVPVENAAMPERTIIQWDKDDLETLGLLKVDCLALGMLSAIRRCFDLVALHRGQHWTLANLPAEDPATYAMVQQADTVGVFQVESRAQMSMLPRLKPACFYDLVIEVAIVRPGPIQGKMVHPYLQRRSGQERIEYPSEQLRAVFERTLGVPIFQEQVMQLAIVAAGFSPGEADQLRRSMAAWKRRGGLDHLQQRILSGMTANGYSADFALQVFEQIRGFGSYGFPESHAASFALLVYASAWLKCHEPAAFCCALLNSQPMGFYAPAQLIADVRRNGGVAVRPLDVRFSQWACTLEVDSSVAATSDGKKVLALRLGFNQLHGFREAWVADLLSEREAKPFMDIEDFNRRAGLTTEAARLLAQANALAGLAGHRHRAAWAVAAQASRAPALLENAALAESSALLTAPDAASSMRADYATLGFSLEHHPMQQLRQRLRTQRYRTATQLSSTAHDSPVRVAGLVLLRQRPATASGVTFVTLEDETGSINLVIWKAVADRQRRVLLESQVLGVHGRLQRVDSVCHVIAGQLHCLDEWIGDLRLGSRDFR